MKIKRILMLVLSLLMVLSITIGLSSCDIFGEQTCNHQWKDATCTEAKVCTVCGKTEGEALGHVIVTDKAVAPTCTETGLTEGSHCSVCDEVIKKQEVVNALGHTYVPVVTPPDCDNWGYTTYACSCGHSYVDDKVSPADHVFGEWEVYTAPTCISEGLERRYCENCDHYEERTVGTPGHTMGNWEVVTEATCTVDGQKRRDCSACDHFETEVIEAPGHRYETEVTSPTCTEDGYTT